MIEENKDKKFFVFFKSLTENNKYFYTAITFPDCPSYWIECSQEDILSSQEIKGKEIFCTEYKEEEEYIALVKHIEKLNKLYKLQQLTKNSVSI